MDPKKQILVNSVISFLQDELHSSTLSEEKKESLEVAIQCLETAFEVESQTIAEKVDLLSFINYKPKLEVTEEHKAQAEDHKNKGNNFMKNSDYSEAITEYSKAIDLNPHNAVYYCNRAAAYTRLLKDAEAINDCQEAIKLDPTYGKAYGRLGIAYSNLNKYDLALKAYQTALKYDPGNSMYETNLKVAEERLGSTMEPPPLGQLPETLSHFVNHPNIVNMASQLLSDPSFCNTMSGLMSMGGAVPGQPQGQGQAADGVPNMPNAMEALLQAGQTLAHRVANEDPNFHNRITSFMQNLANQPGGANPNNTPNTDSNDPDNKDQGSA